MAEMSATALKARKLKAMIIFLSHQRDIVRELDVKGFFRSQQHRDEVYMSIIEALENLEDELEETEEALLNE